MYGGSYVVNLFKQKVASQKNDLFATATLHNNLFCHRISYHLHCTYWLFAYVLRKDMSTLSRRSDQSVHRLEKMFSTKYHAKQLEPYYLTKVLRWELYSSYT